MLSVRNLREGEEERAGYRFPCEVLPAGTAPLIERLARDEDRSITWPGYPDPVERLRILGRK
jgi:hypothetical protein